jgi:ATP-binding cassette subfamily F protein 3
MAAEMLEAANEAYELAGGSTADKLVANVLTGLGFPLEKYDKKCSEFSGGWQVRWD